MAQRVLEDRRVDLRVSALQTDQLRAAAVELGSAAFVVFR
jgi:hypothetical protein